MHEHVVPMYPNIVAVAYPEHATAHALSVG